MSNLSEHLNQNCHLNKRKKGCASLNQVKASRWQAQKERLEFKFWFYGTTTFREPLLKHQYVQLPKYRLGAVSLGVRSRGQSLLQLFKGFKSEIVLSCRTKLLLPEMFRLSLNMPWNIFLGLKRTVRVDMGLSLMCRCFEGKSKPSQYT